MVLLRRARDCDVRRAGDGAAVRSVRIAKAGEESWRSWYKTQRWVRLRLAVLARDGFACARCKAGVQAYVPRGGDQRFVGVVNHRTPHKGDAALFWAEDNLEAVCKPCHDSIIAKEERAGGWR